MESKKKDRRALQNLLYLASVGARGTSADEKMRIDWQDLLPLAAEQGLTSLLACALLKSPRVECPEELKQYLADAMRAEASVNLVRQQRILRLISELKSAGIGVKVLKGYAVGQHYAHPECRGSVDTDLLIDIKQEKKAIRFFEERGFRITPRAATSQHAICQHKKYGMIELHVAPYAEFIREIWFQGMNVDTLIQEEYITVKTPDGSYDSLGCTDQLIFITLHMVKHFILSGMTVRMMLDIALFFAANRDRVDSKRFWETMSRLGYSQLVTCILWSVIRYGCFHRSDFPGCADEAPDQIPLLLDDLIEGGYMGVREEEARYAGGMEYNRQLIMKNRTAAEYWAYMLLLRIRGGAKGVFPAFGRLKELYPCVERMPALAPVFWGYHAVSISVKKVFSGRLQKSIISGNTVIPEESQKRLELFRKLKML